MKKINFSYAILFIPPLLWVIYRSFALDITHDEAWTFHMAYKQLFHSAFRTANNHWLNSFFVLIEHKLLGTEIWKIRLHSIGAFFILAYYLYKIVTQIPNKWWGYATIILVTYNTYTLDFFSLARGYALGLAFGMGALYYILFKPVGVKNRLRIYGLFCLAAASVYTELYLLLAYGIYELFFVFKLNIFSKKKFIEYIKPLWLPIIFLTLAVRNLLLIKEFGDLNEGQSNGFFDDTMGVFFHRAFEPLLSWHTATIISVILFLVLIIFPILKRNAQSAGTQLTHFLLIVFLIHQAFFFLLDVPFPFGRTAMYFIVPFQLCIGLLFGELNYDKHLKLLPHMILILFAFSHVGYAIEYKNAHTTQEWWMGQGLSDVILKINKIENRDLDKLSILFYEGHNGDYQNYYMVVPDKKLIRNFGKIHPFQWEYDFNQINKNPNTFDYILLPDYDSVIKATLDFNLYDSVKYYPDMKTHLLQKKY